MITNLAQTIILKAGTGYWDLSQYPWEGSFRRIDQDTTLVIKCIISHYNDGSPHEIIADYQNHEIGITL